MYPDLTNADAFKTLVMDGSFMGNGGQKWTRGMDIISHYEYNFTDMEAYGQWRQNNPTASIYNNGYWMDWNSTNLDLKKDLATTFKGGDFARQDIIGHEDAVAVSYINLVVLYNDEGPGSLNLYNYTNGNFYEKTKWNALSGGMYDGLSLSETIGSLIGIDSMGGIDDQKMYFLEGDSTIVIYGLEGAFIESYSISLSAYPDLAGYTLGEVIDGKAEGWSYLGWDHGPTFVNIDGIVVPEPAEFSAMLGALVLGFLIFKRRVK